MDKKDSLLPQTHAQEDVTPPATMPSPRRTPRFHAAAFCILLGLFWLARTWNCGHTHLETETKVPLEVHIMSKCPDARDCFSKLVVPAMSDVSDKVDFKLSFIGQVTNDDGVECKHGQTECLGNILMLCAASAYPDPKLNLGFTNCLLASYEDIPRRELISDCALEHGLDFDVLNECMSRDTGAYGMHLLRESVEHSAHVGVQKSCTIRLDGKTRCVYDDEEWKDCEGGSRPEDLVKDIERLYDEARGWTY